MKRVTFLDMVVLNAYHFGLSIMWNSLHVIILPAVLLNFVPDTHKNTYLGLLTFAGLIIAMLIQPLSGAMSDRWSSPWGRRRPLILLGTLLDFIFLALLAWSGGLVWLAIGYIGLQFSSNSAHGPVQGLLPDRVPPEQLGAASGIKNLLDMSGLVVASLLMGRLVPPDIVHPVLSVGVIAAALAAAAAVTLLGAREAPSTSPAGEKPRVSLRQVLRVDFRSHPAYWWLIASRYAFLVGIYEIQSFLQYYVRDVMAVANPVQLTGDLLAAITLTLMAFAFGGGWLGDRFGHKRMLAIAGGLGTVGCLLLMGARTPQTLLVCGSVVGAGIGLFLTSNWALATCMAPSEESGKFLGLTNLATAGAGATARLSGPLIDTLNNARPGAFAGYTAMFIAGAVLTLLSIVLLRHVELPKATPASTST
ncbi:MAG: MFS transporter [Thermoflexales bacterium]|nr:MFS transporter [Thermoflexales bacterium]